MLKGESGGYSILTTPSLRRHAIHQAATQLAQRIQVITLSSCKRGLRSVIVLENGLVVRGCGFGAPGIRVGEIVFTTNIVGYPESLTDPSYKGQILVYTHPLVGNYGVPSRKLDYLGIPLNYESDKIQVEAFVVAYETSPSHWASTCSLHEWLKEEGVPGVSGVDTRSLVKIIREKGVMMAVVAVYPENEEVDLDELLAKLESAPRYDDIDYASRVSPLEPVIHRVPGDGKGTLIITDCGIKYGILREILRRGYDVVRIPCHSDPVRYLEEYNAVGVVVSNGPGNPVLLKDVIENIRALIEYRTPLLGICLGHQLISLALGATTYKLKYGHRGPNKPVLDLSRHKCYITTQNHGYAINTNSLEDTGLRLWMINADDRTVEALIHEKLPVLTTQFHPEASPGPLDTTWVFDYFLKMVRKR